MSAALSCVEVLRAFQNSLLSDQPLSTGITPAQSFDIYREGYFDRLCDILRKDFPMTCEWADQPAESARGGFDQMASDYVRAHPARDFSIKRYGASFPDFLQRNYSQYAELASLEWAMVVAGDAADQKALRHADLQGIAPEVWPTLRFTVHPSVQWLPLTSYATERYIDVNTPLNDAEAVPHVCLVWRIQSRNEVNFLVLPPVAEHLLSQLRAGQCLGDACDGLTQYVSHAQAEVEVTHWLGHFLEHELFVFVE